MKPFCFFTLAFVFMSLGKVRAQSSSPGPVGWWRAHGSYADSIGGHDGSPVGNVNFAPVDGRQGFLFDGFSSGVEIPDSPAFATDGSLTICAWIKADSARPGNIHQVFFRGDDRNGLDPYYLDVQDEKDGRATLRFHIESETAAKELQTSIPLGRYLHVAAVLDAQARIMRLFVDGKPAAEAATNLRPLRDLDPARHPGIGIGNTQDVGAVNEPFDGIIDEAQLYNRALPPQEIAEEMAATAHPLPASGVLSSDQPYRYWPRFPRPLHIITLKQPSSTPQWNIFIQTMAGLAARSELMGKTRDLIWVPDDDPAYARWFQAMVKRTGATVEGPLDPWEVLARLKADGVVRGYILYHYDDSHREIYHDGPLDPSSNVATSLAALFGGVAISEDLEAEARAHGLQRVGDVRGWTEQRCFDRYSRWFSRRVLAAEDPKVSNIREMTVAMQAFMIAGTGPTYERVLSWLEPDSPVLGWPVGDDERGVTQPSTQRAAFQTASNWCANLPALATETPVPSSALRKPPTPSLWDLKWEDNVHYAAFTMSDGDNEQWLMGGFYVSGRRSWWSSPDRGSVPIGWTIDYPDLAQICPYTLEYLFSTAKPGDDFLLFAGGYYYPDLYGNLRTGVDSMDLHARRLGYYFNLGGFSLLMANFQKWDCQTAFDACHDYVHWLPGLDGIVTIQYSPYTGGHGAVHWIPGGADGETPIVSTQLAIWNHADFPGGGGPARIAGMINALPHLGAPDDVDHFSVVIVHAWSWFKHLGKDEPVGNEEIDQNSTANPGTGGGMAAAKWCSDRLQPYVRVVTPSELVELMRLRVHPQPTLSSALAALDARLRATRESAPDPAAREKLKGASASILKARVALGAGDYHAAFDAGRAANVVLDALNPVSPAARQPR